MVVIDGRLVDELPESQEDSQESVDAIRLAEAGDDGSDEEDAPFDDVYTEADGVRIMRLRFRHEKLVQASLHFLHLPNGGYVSSFETHKLFDGGGHCFDFGGGPISKSETTATSHDFETAFDRETSRLLEWWRERGGECQIARDAIEDIAEARRCVIREKGADETIVEIEESQDEPPREPPITPAYQGVPSAIRRFQQSIEELSREVARAHDAVVSAKEALKVEREALDLATEQLADVYRQMTAASAPPATNDISEGSAGAMSLVSLGIPEGILKVLAQCPDGPILSLDDIVRWRSAGRPLTAIPKIGKKKADCLAGFLGGYWDVRDAPSESNSQPQTTQTEA